MKPSTAVYYNTNFTPSIPQRWPHFTLPFLSSHCCSTQTWSWCTGYNDSRMIWLFTAGCPCLLEDQNSFRAILSWDWPRDFSVTKQLIHVSSVIPWDLDNISAENKTLRDLGTKVKTSKQTGYVSVILKSSFSFPFLFQYTRTRDTSPSRNASH